MAKLSAVMAGINHLWIDHHHFDMPLFLTLKLSSRSLYYRIFIVVMGGVIKQNLLFVLIFDKGFFFDYLF